MTLISPAQQAYAYSTKCIPYDHGIRDRVPYTTLAVKNLSSHSLNKKLHDSQIMTPPLTLTEQEQKASAKRCVWVGMVLLTTDPARIIGFCVPDKGTSIEHATEATVLPTESQALRAVVAVDSKHNQYFALVNQKDGLCEGFKVDLKQVYFFPEFRDDKETAEAKREIKFSDKIKEWKNGVMAKQHAEVKANHRVQESRGKIGSSTLSLPMRASTRNQVQALGATYELTNASWALDALSQVLSQYDADLKSAPSWRFTGLHTLVSIGKEFTEDDAIQAVKDISGLWSDLSVLAIEVQDIQQIAQRLRQEEVVVPYSLLRPFVVKAIRQLRKDPSQYSGGDDHDMQEILTHVRLQCGDPAVPPGKATPPKEPWRSLLKTMTCHLEEILDYNTQYGEAMKESLGGKLTGMPIGEVINFFANSVDIESARLAIREIFFSAMEMMLAKDKGVASKLKEHVAVMKMLDETLDRNEEGEQEEMEEEEIEAET